MVSFWEEWGECYGNCKFALKVRNRGVVRPPFPEKSDGRFVIRPCPPLFEVVTCVPAKCIFDIPFDNSDPDLEILDPLADSFSRANAKGTNDTGHFEPIILINGEGKLEPGRENSHDYNDLIQLTTSQEAGTFATTTRVFSSKRSAGGESTPNFQNRQQLESGVDFCIAILSHHMESTSWKTLSECMIRSSHRFGLATSSPNLSESSLARWAVV